MTRLTSRLPLAVGVASLAAGVTTIVASIAVWQPCFDGEPEGNYGPCAVVQSAAEFVVIFWLWAAVFVALIVSAIVTRAQPFGAVVGIAVLLALNPLGDSFAISPALFNKGEISWDTTPGTGIATGTGIAVAGILLLTTRHVTRRAASERAAV